MCNEALGGRVLSVVVPGSARATDVGEAVEQDAEREVEP